MNVIALMTDTEKELARTFAQEYVNHQRFFGEWPARWHSYILNYIDNNEAALVEAGQAWVAATTNGGK